jgi:hypothetical protein
MNPVKPGQRVMTELFKSITSMANTTHPIVDVHTHVYLPRYAAELRARTSAPRILNWTNGTKTEERLLILDGEPSGGRPIGPQVCLLFQMKCKHIHLEYISTGIETRSSNSCGGMI